MPNYTKKKRRGAITILAIGVMFVILLFALFFLEVFEMYDTQYAIEVRAQRAINTTVEYAMDDTWRADGYNFMDKNVAQNTLFGNLNSDLNVDSNGNCYDENGKLIYHVEYGGITWISDHSNGMAEGLSIPITVTMTSGISGAYSISGHTWTNTFESTNFRVDDDLYAGAPLTP